MAHATSDLKSRGPLWFHHTWHFRIGETYGKLVETEERIMGEEQPFSNAALLDFYSVLE